ncbi:MAG: hypothetical protein ACLFWL_00550 [Candidatus Brocadiia bacterium]
MALDDFPRYTDYNPKIPVWCITPEERRCIHRFFDTSPFSPSGRSVAVFRMPFEDRCPEPGDMGEIVVVDLEDGEERVIDTTCGWEPQMGANLNWGGDDSTLFYNDVDLETWEPFAVKFDLVSGERERLEGCVYQASPDGKWLVSANMTTMRRTQTGYGVMIPDELVARNQGLKEDDGLYLTDTESGEMHMVISIREAVEACSDRIDMDEYERGETYGFHSKFTPDGQRLMFSLRHTPPHEEFAMWPTHFEVLTLSPDGTDIHDAVPAQYWEKGGHHSNFFPDGQKISFNLNMDGDGMKFCEAACDGSFVRKLFDDPPGGGHPTVHPDGRHILTDSYITEPVAYGDGTIPIRWIDRRKREETHLIRIRTETSHQGGESALRVDPHPAWDRDYRRIAFNGFADGTRRVYVADLSGIL